MKPLLALVGPTASGKTSLSLLLAKELDGEIVSADSRQIYRQLNIGTAKPDLSALQAVPHHFIDILNPDEEYNAGIYGEQARAVVAAIQQKGKIPIVVGGSGLYIRSLLDGLFEGPGKDPEVRSELEERLSRIGLQELFDELKKVDPHSASSMKEVKARQVIRALEVYYSTGIPISRFHAQQRKGPRLLALQTAIAWKRSILYDRINRRVDDMLTEGFVKEAEALLRKGYDRRINALNTVGYKEVFEYLEGNLPYEEMRELIKKNTRRFAKRQLTWFRSDPRIQWIPIEATQSLESLAGQILQRFRSFVQNVH